MSSADVPQTAPIVGGWRERMAAKQAQKKEAEESAQPATAAATGWSNTPSKWRAPAGAGTIDLASPISAPRQNGPSASVIATPSATPVPDRDATVEVASEPETKEEPVQQQEPTEEDLNAVQWYYRDPQGEEQGMSYSYCAMLVAYHSRPILCCSDARLVQSLVLLRRSSRETTTRDWLPHPRSAQGGHWKCDSTIPLCHSTSTASTQLANAQHLASSHDADWRFVPQSCHPQQRFPIRSSNEPRSTWYLASICPTAI
jgi:hypothetical protein